MEFDSLDALEQWIRELPRAAMQYPEELRHKLKYYFWKVYTPYHPFVRDLALRLKIIRHEGRQEFLLGHIKPEKSIREFIADCVRLGFGNHFVAWHDDGEIASLRIVEDFSRQYHLRIFTDGEVRGHYEYTPECYPRRHMKKMGMEDRRAFFYDLLGDHLTPSAG